MTDTTEDLLRRELEQVHGEVTPLSRSIRATPQPHRRQ
jgi:hypothetical protein